METYYFHCNIDKKICSSCIQYINNVKLFIEKCIGQMIHVDTRTCIKQAYLEFRVTAVLTDMRVEAFA